MRQQGGSDRVPLTRSVRSLSLSHFRHLDKGQFTHIRSASLSVQACKISFRGQMNVANHFIRCCLVVRKNIYVLKKHLCTIPGLSYNSLHSLCTTPLPPASLSLALLYPPCLPLSPGADFIFVFPVTLIGTWLGASLGPRPQQGPLLMSGNLKKVGKESGSESAIAPICPCGEGVLLDGGRRRRVATVDRCVPRQREDGERLHAAGDTSALPSDIAMGHALGRLF